MMYRPSVVRAKILKILEDEMVPLNSLQICRLLNGADHKVDIRFCRGDEPWGWTDPNGFKERNWGAYTGCGSCNNPRDRVYYFLRQLEEKGYVDSRLEFRSDPIQPLRKDWMRMWALKGKLPSLDNHV